MSEKNQSDLDRTKELFQFLQGKVSEGYTIPVKEIPKLTADQAWTVIWYLANQYWQVTDHVERCCVCGDLYDSWSSGNCLDFGKAPHHFCENCMDGDEYFRKATSRSNPDKQQRKDLLDK